MDWGVFTAYVMGIGTAFLMAYAFRMGRKRRQTLDIRGPISFDIIRQWRQTAWSDDGTTNDRDRVSS